MHNYDVIIIGAGPYGLSAAAHLKAIKGLDFHIFGDAMALWKYRMPVGMFLRSPFSASHIADPHGTLSLDAFLSEQGNHLPKPIPLKRFIEYGCWFQQRAAPKLDTRDVRWVERTPKGFMVTTVDGEVFSSQRVVVATGPGPCKWRPPEFDDLPESMASHSSDHHDLSRFSGKRILVVGAGQSALENAALLHEGGSNVVIASRAAAIHWLKWRGRLFSILPVGRVLYSPRDVGPAGVSQLVARPDLFRRLPRRFQDWATRRSIRPAGALWLMDRLKDVKIRTSVSISSVSIVAGQLRVRFCDQTEETFDHIMFSTGFRIDLKRYSFLSPELMKSIEQVAGYPRLKAGLESSVPGLHFLGALSGWSFGPVARFVSGTFYSPQALARSIEAAA